MSKFTVQKWHNVDVLFKEIPNGVQQVTTKQANVILNRQDRRIAELQGSVITIKSCYENESLEHDKTRKKAAELQAQVDDLKQQLDEANEECDSHLIALGLMQPDEGEK